MIQIFKRYSFHKQTLLASIMTCLICAGNSGRSFAEETAASDKSANQSGDELFDQYLNNMPAPITVAGHEQCVPCPQICPPVCPPSYYDQSPAPQTPFTPSTNLDEANQQIQRLQDEINSMRNNQQTQIQNTQPQQQQNFNFNRSAQSNLLASRDVPAMIGDFFGGAGAFSVCIPNIVSSPVTILSNPFVKVNNFTGGVANLSTVNFAALPGNNFNFTSNGAVVDVNGNPTIFWSDDPGFNRFSLTPGSSLVTNGGNNFVLSDPVAILDDPNGAFPAVTPADIDNNITPDE